MIQVEPFSIMHGFIYVYNYIYLNKGHSGIVVNHHHAVIGYNVVVNIIGSDLDDETA